MKSKTNRAAVLFLSLVLALAAAACTKEGPRKYHGRTDTEYTENPCWTLSYTGREVDSGDGWAYVVDPVYVKSTDNVSYYLDLVSLDDWKNTYSSSPAKLISEKSSSIDKDYIYSGDSRNSFDALDAGGGDWVALAWEVNASGVPGTRYAVLQFKTEAVKMVQDNTYEISYDGRRTIDDGETETEVDAFTIQTDSEFGYYMDISYPEDIAQNYSGDPVVFFNAVLDNLAADLSDGEDFSGILYCRTSGIEFYPLESGDWTAYAFGVDNLGNLTGSWSKLDFNIADAVSTTSLQKAYSAKNLRVIYDGTARPATRAAWSGTRATSPKGNAASGSKNTPKRRG